MAGAHTPKPDFGRIVLLYLLPVVISVSFAAALSDGRNRLAVVGVGVAVWITGFCLIMAWSATDGLFSPEVKVAFVNATGEHLLVYYSREGESLRRHYPYRPGQRQETSIGFKKRGPWLRVVAFRMDGPMDFRDFTELQGHYEFFPFEIPPGGEYRLQDRKLFGRVFTWDMLQGAGNRIVIDSGEG